MLVKNVCKLSNLRVVPKKSFEGVLVSLTRVHNYGMVKKNSRSTSVKIQVVKVQAPMVK